jgi:hypothetical protein
VHSCSFVLLIALESPPLTLVHLLFRRVLRSIVWAPVDTNRVLLSIVVARDSSVLIRCLYLL